jgi:hypothetical protein
MSTKTDPVNLDPERAAESNLARILGITTTFHGIALIIVILRMYTRVYLLKAPGRDDIFMGIAAVCVC